MMEGLDGTNSTGDVGGSNEAADGEAEDVWRMGIGAPEW